MKIETLILKTDLRNIFHPTIVEHLCREGYNKTHNKFSISYMGSKGYLNHLAIECEGYQTANNRVSRNDLFTKAGTIKKKVLNIFHSEENGVRLSFGKDHPQLTCRKMSQEELYKIRKDASRVNKVQNTTIDDELPF